MWTRRPQLLWFKLQHKNLRLSIPVTFSVFQELLDCALDLFFLLGAVAPNANLGSPPISAVRLQEFIQLLTKLLRSIGEDGPYDLIDVSLDQVSLSIHVK